MRSDSAALGLILMAWASGPLYTAAKTTGVGKVSDPLEFGAGWCVYHYRLYITRPVYPGMHYHVLIYKCTMIVLLVF